MNPNMGIALDVLEVKQPIGSFYIGVMKARDLIAISSADMRRMEGGLDQYVGIQRKISRDRVGEIAEFVRSIDATFPTSVVLAIRGECAEVVGGKLRIFSGVDSETGEIIPLQRIASILDGQHRVEGLRASDIQEFDVPVSLFVNADISDQAYIFATVNLAQTKVNKSLVYDLLDFATARSPQKSAHDIAVAFDRYEKGPFYKRIKRLGAATPGRSGELLAQATVVNSILPLISRDPERDRFQLAKKRKVGTDATRYEETPLRNLWINEQDPEIARILLRYFDAVKKVWPTAWSSSEKGHILWRTNGFRALMRLFKLIYLKERPTVESEKVLSVDVFVSHLRKSSLEAADFTTLNFAPGTSGETSLFKRLRGDLKL